MNFDVKLDILAAEEKNFPKTGHPEIVILGRSNVGKSSFINSIMNRKQLAYTSRQPGKTQTLNFYNVNDSFYLVDVPGYGYARVSKAQRESFISMIDEYLFNREPLKLIIQLIDARHLPTKDDLRMFDFLKTLNAPMVLVATKVDKIPKTKRYRQEKEIRNAFGLDDGDGLILYSSVTTQNREIIYEIIDQVIQ
jgi:GTP-binding protein